MTRGRDVFELLRPARRGRRAAGRAIYCGARDGDYFELQGEMLTLPPGQGFSIYSLAAVLPLLAAKQRPTDPNDWMTTDAEVACPDPNCPTRLRITRPGLRRFRRSETTAVPLPAEERMTSRRATTRARLRDLAASSRAAGSSPAATARSIGRAVDDMRRRLRRRRHDLRLRRHLHRRRGALSARCARACARRAARTPRGASTSTPSSCPTWRSCRRSTAPMSRRSSTARCSACGVERLDLVQFHWWDYRQPALARGVGWLDACAARASCALIGGTNFDTRRICARSSPPAFRSPRCRCSIPCSTGAGERLCRALPRARRRAALLRHGGRRLSVRALARRARAAPRRSPTARWSNTS